MRPERLALTLLLAGCAATTPAPRPATQRLRIGVTADVRAGTIDVEVRVGADEGLPPRWRFGDPGLVRDLRLEVRNGQWRPLTAKATVELPSGARALRWRYAVGEGNSMRTGRGAAGGYAAHGRCYLGRPDPVPSCSLELTWRSPTGDPLRPLLPWPVDARGVTTIRAAELWNPGFHAFGGRRATLTLNGGQIDVAILPGPLQRTDAELLAWLKQAAEEVQSVRRGAFPHRRIPVVLIPSRAAWGDVVPFGTVEWSAPQSVALLVRCNATAAELKEDWVGVHELMHLTHPNIRPRTPWLSEGLATYYQMVGRMRSGRRTRDQMWGWFRAGVRTGRREAGARSLADLSAELSRTHAYMAVYWGGALLMLDLDLTIREATGGRRSLDDVLIGLQRTGADSTVEAFGAAVDATAGRPVWAECSKRHLTGPGLREGERLFTRCGVEGVRDQARLGPGPRAASRRAIEQPSARRR